MLFVCAFYFEIYRGTWQFMNMMCYLLVGWAE